ncbi:AAA family ATPase [Patescibacteria group bacterium]|nr:AAA family ATPase [Patescibacteria group bacterium]
MYIGLTGYLGTGKGVLAKILENQGFKYTSLSNVVREEATKQGLEHTRENLIQVGNLLREKHGSSYYARRVVEMVSKEPETNWVIDGIRNPAEIKALQEMKNFHLVGISASPQTIVNRILSRKRDGDKLTEEDILAKLDIEKGIGQPADGQQVAKCLEIADFFIINEGTVEELEKKINHFIGLIKGTQRPTFDEVFMGIAYQWSERSTCLRRKVGALIAKDSQQLTAGYNGAPRGMKHSAELGGCLRDKLNIPSGQRHEICRGTHAEQNAITQAAKFGISIDGSTLYCNTHPCVICTKMIINAGIEKVVYDSDYNDPLSKEILGEQKMVEIVRYEGLRFKPNYREN